MLQRCKQWTSFLPRAGRARPAVKRSFRRRAWYGRSGCGTFAALSLPGCHSQRAHSFALGTEEMFTLCNLPRWSLPTLTCVVGAVAESGFALLAADFVMDKRRCVFQRSTWLDGQARRNGLYNRSDPRRWDRTGARAQARIREGADGSPRPCGDHLTRLSADLARGTERAMQTSVVATRSR